MTLFCVSVDGGEMFTLLGATYPADERKKKKRKKSAHVHPDKCLLLSVFIELPYLTNNPGIFI